MFGLFKRAKDAASKTEAVNGKGTLCAGCIECPCIIRTVSGKRLVVTLLRQQAVNGDVVLVDHKRALALDASVSALKGNEVTLDVRASHPLGGLVPARLSRARDIYKRG